MGRSTEIDLQDRYTLARKLARDVRRESDGVPCTFHEDDHLNGSTNMFQVIKALIEKKSRRKSAGEPTTSIPLRPDHGHELLNDIGIGGKPG